MNITKVFISDSRSRHLVSDYNRLFGVFHALNLLMALDILNLLISLRSFLTIHFHLLLEGINLRLCNRKKVQGLAGSQPSFAKIEQLSLILIIL
jgi:hypothetical protein